MNTETQMQALDRASLLVGAIPRLQGLHGQVVVVKFGGNAMTDDALMRAFAEDVVFLRLCGVRVVVLHGGGPQIDSELRRLGIAPKFEHGLRVTDAETMSVVRRVLVEQVQRDIVGVINAHGPYACGLSGDEHRLLTAKRRVLEVAGVAVDIGFVGEVIAVDVAAVELLLNTDKIPVISSVASDGQGQIYNVNADTAAAVLAASLGAKKLLFLTDVEGLYRNWPDTSDLIPSISAAELRTLMPALSDGMIPKIEAAIQAIDGGVNRAHIIDGRLPHSVLLELVTNEGVGTEVYL